MKLPVALTIAGSDSGGGAGIQADLKTFAALGVHGTSAITAITAQNTQTVSDILELPVELIRAQIDRVVEDLHPAAAKTGMLSSPEIIATVAQAIRDHHLEWLVVDPVMVAKGGAKLLRDEAVDALRQELIPLAAIITPNLPEAEVLLGRRLVSLDDRRRAARELLELGSRAVILKGGHGEGPVVDLYQDRAKSFEITHERVPTRNTHGSGCVFSAALAASLAKGLTPVEAFGAATTFVQGAIREALELGESEVRYTQHCQVGSEVAAHKLCRQCAFIVRLDGQVFLALEHMIGGQYQVLRVDNAARGLPRATVDKHQCRLDTLNRVGHLVGKRL